MTKRTGNHRAENPSFQTSSRRDFLRNSILLGIVGLLMGPNVSAHVVTTTSRKRKLRPVLEGNWWLIGPPPPKGQNNIPVKIGKDGQIAVYESVDHHIVKAQDGY